MIFDDAYALLEIGTLVQVEDGQPEPMANEAWRQIWRSRNPRGRLVEKIAGPPRALRIEVETQDLSNGVNAVVSFVIVEASEFLFKEVSPVDETKLSATKRNRRRQALERARVHRLSSAEILVETETRVFQALRALFPDLTITAEQRQALFPHARDS